MPLRARLVLASALMLFLELSLIRWTGAYVLHLSYFSNFVLLGSFLGIGLGFLRASADRAPAPYYSPMVLIGLIGFLSAYPVAVDRKGSTLVFFTSLSTTGPPIWLTLPAVFLAVAAIMAGPGELVGACFEQLPRLDAYRYDLLGSIAGIAGFTGLAFLDAPPLVWFAVIGALFVVLLGRPGVSVSVSLVVALLLMLGYPLRHDKDTFWSPYYQVKTFPTQDSQGGPSWIVQVNGIPHQRLTSAAARAQEESWYLQPYLLAPRVPGNVLVVGAGTGTDVAIALARHARHVDAVEIDPTLLRFGRQHDPDHVYQDPRVTAHVNDGRAYLESTGKKFDLILFALPDSLTLVSGASSLRLESYLFTLQAVRSARSHLAPGGAFAMYNFYREAWLVDRLAATTDAAFGHPPCLAEDSSAPNRAVILAALSRADQTCGTQTWQRSAATPPPATDDKPFLYLEHSRVPSLYVGTLGLILLASVVAVLAVLLSRPVGRGASRLGALRPMWSYRDLFLLGAAFLLLETKNVTGFALLFGTTWLVNSFVFAGVLVAVLAAVEVTRRRATPPVPVMYGVLIAGLALAWVVPASWLLSLPALARAPAAILIAFLPVFAANVIFAKRFAGTEHPAIAFATNLLGSMLGGSLEYLALAFGYRSLLIIAALLYISAYLLMPRSLRTAAAAPTAPERGLAAVG
jgi:SAM-dependent methyltransferase